jgi:hypothetical protein
MGRRRIHRIWKARLDMRARFWIFAPLGLFSLLFALWSAYWVIARGELSKGIDGWIEAERANGAVIEYSDKTLTGYPFRFTLNVEAPRFESRQGLTWQGEELQLIMQPWNWQHVMARAPGRSVVTDVDGIRHTAVLNRKSVGSASWDGTGVKRLAVLLDEADLVVGGSAMSFRGASLNLSPTPGAPDDLRISGEWARLELAEPPAEFAFLGTVSQPSRMIAEIEGFYPAFLSAGGNIERLPAELARAEGAVSLGQLLLNWGALKLGAKGEVDFAGGAGNGALNIRLDDGAGLKAELEAVGASDAAIAGVTALETMSKDGGFLTLTIKDGDVLFLGQPLATLNAPPPS